MATSSYNRQHLAVFAAGHISGDGNTSQAFGCSLTRIDTGHYGLILGADVGLVNDESFTRVQVKGTSNNVAAVVDTSNTLKTIHVIDDGGATPADADIEVAVFRSIVMG